MDARFHLDPHVLRHQVIRSVGRRPARHGFVATAGTPRHTRVVSISEWRDGRRASRVPDPRHLEVMTDTPAVERVVARRRPSGTAAVGRSSSAEQVPGVVAVFQRRGDRIQVRSRRARGIGCRPERDSPRTRPRWSRPLRATAPSRARRWKRAWSRRCLRSRIVQARVTESQPLARTNTTAAIAVGR